MCTISMIADDWRRTVPDRHPWVNPPNSPNDIFEISPTRAELDALRREIAELRDLLKAAKKYDEATGQADCESEEKIELLRRLSDYLGIDLSELF